MQTEIFLMISRFMMFCGCCGIVISIVYFVGWHFYKKIKQDFEEPLFNLRSANLNLLFSQANESQNLFISKVEDIHTLLVQSNDLSSKKEELTKLLDELKNIGEDLEPSLERLKKSVDSYFNAVIK